jgi:hypothetical protein
MKPILFLADEGVNGGFLALFHVLVEGSFRLKFELRCLCSSEIIEAECFSDRLVVYSRKLFPGMMVSTDLTEAIVRSDSSKNTAEFTVRNSAIAYSPLSSGIRR